MTAATQDRITPRRGACRRSRGVAASKLCYAGTMAVMNASGFVQPATAATGLVAMGVFKSQYDNSAGADGDQVAECERGVYRFDNSAGVDEITLADTGKLFYMVDDQTVALTDGGGTRSPGGIIDDVDGTGVWCFIDPNSGINT